MKNKFFSVLIIVIIFFLTGCFTEPIINNTYELDLTLLDSEIYEGEVALEQIRIKEIDKEGNIVYISSNKSMYSKSDFELFSKAGTHNITIYYKFFEEEFEITILEKINNHPASVFKSENAYYEMANGLCDEELKLSLRIIISVVTKTETYDDLRYDIAKTDTDPNQPNNLILLYTNKSVPSKWDSGNTWNREHVWPRSLGWFDKEGAGADIHHIRPTNNSANSARGNKKYGEVDHTNTNKKSVTISGYGSVHYGYATKEYFEPLDEVKGDIARIIFYLMVRYEEADKYTFTAIVQSKEMLLRWNELDPVNDFERYRNEECYKIQGNRNPFIDHPECAELIWGD